MSTGKIGLSSGTALIRYAIILAVLVGAVLSYWSSAANQQFEVPGIRAQLRVTELSAHHSDPTTILNDLTRIARDDRGDILVELPSPQGRTAYGAGHHSDQWAQHGYQGLPGTPDVQFVDFAQLPHADYRQVLELSGSAAFQQHAMEYLDQQGIPFDPLVAQPWQFLLFGSALGDLTFLLAGFCLALCAIGVVLNSHADAVRRLHGYGLLHSAAYELQRASGWMFFALLAVPLSITVVLAFWASVPAALQWLWYQVIFIGLALVLCVVSTIAALWLLRRLSTTDMLAGKLPGKTVLSSMYLVRIGVCIAAVSMCIGTINYSTEWFTQRSERDLWAATPPAYSIELSGARSLEDLQETSSILATHLRDLSAQNKLMYAQFNDAGFQPKSGLDRSVMVYNETAARQSLRGDIQQVAEHLQSGGQPVWLQPDNLPGTIDTERIRSTMSDDPNWQIATYPATGSQAFTWEVGTDEWMNRAEVTDPIVVIYPNNHLPISDKNLVAALTQKDATLVDYTDYQQLQADPQVGSFIRSAMPMSQEWATHHQTMGRTVWVYAGGLLAALLLCAISALAVFSTWLKAFHQKMRAHYIHGVMPRMLITIVLRAEIIVGGALASYLWNRGEPVRQWSQGPLFGAADPSLMAMFHIPAAAWWLVLILTIVTSMPIMLVVLRNRSISQLVHTRR